MSYPYSELVAPAILLENPGVTKEEFANLLDRTHSSESKEFSFEDPWDSHEKVSDPGRFGLERVASSLCLDEKKGFEDLMTFESLRTRTLAEWNALYYKFPPEDKYDFTQPAGHFDVPFNGHDFLWLNRGGRYYLNPTTFDQIPVGLWVSGWKGYGYIDLIVTAEAVRQKAWKVLSRGGPKHLPSFFETFPDSYQRYSQAVFDAETSMNAKRRGLTYQEFLRMRLRV